MNLAKHLIYDKDREHEIKELLRDNHWDRYLRRYRYTDSGKFRVCVKDKNSMLVARSKDMNEAESIEAFNKLLKEIGQEDSPNYLTKGKVLSMKMHPAGGWAVWERIGEIDWADEDTDIDDSDDDW